MALFSGLLVLAGYHSWFFLVSSVKFDCECKLYLEEFFELNNEGEILQKDLLLLLPY